MVESDGDTFRHRFALEVEVVEELLHLGKPEQVHARRGCIKDRREGGFQKQLPKTLTIHLGKVVILGHLQQCEARADACEAIDEDAGILLAQVELQNPDAGSRAFS
jgi:hypothetical protein